MPKQESIETYTEYLNRLKNRMLRQVHLLEYLQTERMLLLEKDRVFFEVKETLGRIRGDINEMHKDLGKIQIQQIQIRTKSKEQKR